MEFVEEVCQLVTGQEMLMLDLHDYYITGLQLDADRHTVTLSVTDLLVQSLVSYVFPGRQAV
jgi:hypothetical protein